MLILTMEFFAEFSDKKYLTSKEGLKPAISCVGDHNATTAPASHM